MSCSSPAVCASSASRLLIPHCSAMSRANAATAALWRAVRLSRLSSERTSEDSTPQDSAAYWPVRSRAMTTSRDMYAKADEDEHDEDAGREAELRVDGGDRDA